MFDWDDIRIFLAVARTGSTLAAARDARLTQTSVARRIERLERSVGLRLFDRKQAGYSANEAGRALREYAEAMELDAQRFSERLAALARQISGVIRVTTNEGLANMVLAPAIHSFRERFRDVRVDLLVDEKRLDLAAGVADIALRTGPPSTGGSLIVRRMPDLAFGVYCSRQYAEERGFPRNTDEIAGHPVIGVDGAIAELPAFTWLRQVVPDCTVATRSSSITNLIATARSGLGVTALPCFLADHDPTLVRCLGPIENAYSKLWLVSRQDLRNEPRIRAFLDHLANHIVGLRRTLAGIEQ